jgi:ribosome-binding protein aMBF1 (putative translation factor)
MEFENKMVEAIEEGRIVQVSESYAKREGLVILKKPELQIKNQIPSHLETKREKTRPLTEYVKSKPDWREKQVMSELIENFHWQIRFGRRQKGFTRKQFAKMANITEDELQIIESGRLPSNDFIIINKIQNTLGINLRKDGKNFDVTTEEILEKARQKQEEKKQFSKPAKKPEESDSEMLGRGIEILDEEI